jgi:membrane protease YdiL (CAAX protease family)
MNWLAAVAPLLSEWLGAVAVVMLFALSPAFRRRIIPFKYLQREALACAALFIVALIIAFVLQGNIPPLNWLTGQDLDPLWQRVALALVLVGLAGLALFIRRQPLRSAGWERIHIKPSSLLGLALVFMAAFLRGKIYSLLDGVSAREGIALLLWFVAAFAEETVFRGYLQLRLSAIFGDRYGWLVVVPLYMIWNLPRLLLDPATLPLSLLLLAVQGILLGWIARKSNGVLAPAMYRAVSEWVGML